jgi:hypothetical protein
MLTYRLNNCVACTTIPVLLQQIDCKLTKLAKAQYNNIVLALGLTLDSTVMYDLLNYKRILECKACNADYASCYSVEEIAGKVKILIHK